MSDSRKSIKVQFRTQRFPTVKLTKSLMSELLDVVYDEYGKLQEAKASFWMGNGNTGDGNTGNKNLGDPCLRKIEKCCLDNILAVAA